MIAVAGGATLSLLAGLAVAAVLGQIGDQVSELLEPEAWSSAPLTRDEFAEPARTAARQPR
jgi:hypothetical protein